MRVHTNRLKKYHQEDGGYVSSRRPTNAHADTYTDEEDMGDDGSQHSPPSITPDQNKNQNKKSASSENWSSDSSDTDSSHDSDNNDDSDSNQGGTGANAAAPGHEHESSHSSYSEKSETTSSSGNTDQTTRPPATGAAAAEKMTNAPSSSSTSKASRLLDWLTPTRSSRSRHKKAESTGETHQLAPHSASNTCHRKKRKDAGLSRKKKD